MKNDIDELQKEDTANEQFINDLQNKIKKQEDTQEKTNRRNKKNNMVIKGKNR